MRGVLVFEVLIDMIGEQGVQVLLEGLYSDLESKQEDIASICRYGVWSQKTIISVMDNLVCLKALREQYDEIHKAFEAYQKEE